MVLDKIENLLQYSNLHLGFTKASEFILGTDFSKLEDGKYSIDGDNIFALLQKYETKDSENAKPETHFKYIDIQYLISGTELMGIALLDKQAPITKDIKNDIAFYENEVSFIKFQTGMFAIFFPHDMHMPGIKLEESGTVRKVVIKIKL